MIVETASIADIFVWRCSSTLFSVASSVLASSSGNNSILLTLISIWFENESNSTKPLILQFLPTVKELIVSKSHLLPSNILKLIEEEPSVNQKVAKSLSFFVCLSSLLKIFPSTMTRIPSFTSTSFIG